MHTTLPWAEENNIEWRFHLPYNPTGAGLIERYNGILKAALKTDSQSLQGWTKWLYETLRDLNERPWDGRPSALRMLQATWATPLRIQMTGTDHQVRPQIGNENHLLLPAPENLDPGTHRIKWPWKVQVGPRWCGLLAPWGRLLEVGKGIFWELFLVLSPICLDNTELPWHQLSWQRGKWVMSLTSSYPITSWMLACPSWLSIHLYVRYELSSALVVGLSGCSLWRRGSCSICSAGCSWRQNWRRFPSIWSYEAYGFIPEPCRGWFLTCVTQMLFRSLHSNWFLFIQMLLLSFAKGRQRRLWMMIGCQKNRKDTKPIFLKESTTEWRWLMNAPQVCQ